MFTPPGSTVHLPAGAHEVKATTNQLVLLGRVRANDDADAPAAYAATADVKLQPLAAITGGATQPEAPPMAKTPGTPQTVGANGLGYFDELGDALAVNPPTDEQRRTAIDGAKSLLGVGPGRHATSDPGADQATTDSGRALNEERQGHVGDFVDGLAPEKTLAAAVRRAF